MYRLGLYFDLSLGLFSKICCAMKTMLSEQVHTFGQYDVSSIVFQGVPYFRATDITLALGYANGSQAVRTHVNKDYVKSLVELSGDIPVVLCPVENDKNAIRAVSGKANGFKSPLYIREYGVYDLIMHSKKPEAMRFHRWVVEEVLPEIQRTGKYMREQQMSLMNETDLHYKVIDFTRKFFKESVIVPGLGELQDTKQKQGDAYRKGYRGGQPDILILNRTRKASGLAIELKTPLGCGSMSEKQESFLQELKKNKYEILISNSYDEIVVKIIEYREAARRCIPKRMARSSDE